MPEVKTITASYEYSAGGYPNPTYTGIGSFRMNRFDDEPDEDVKDRAFDRARRECARDMCKDVYGVKIKNVTLSA